jgi:hypothetical protein
MRPLGFLFLVLFLTAAAGCKTQRESPYIPSNVTASDLNDVIVLADPAITSPSLLKALEQFNRVLAPLVLQTRRPITSAEEALPEIRKVARPRVVAVTEFQNWFWYANDVDRDPPTKAILRLMGGYAIQKGGQNIVQWSVR